MGKGVKTSRGSAIASSLGLNTAQATITVGVPASSNNRATCPTDTWHTGQTGTRITPSAPFS